MSYIFYDVETTGLNRNSDILSLAAIKCNDQFEIQSVYNEYFLYGAEVPSGAVAVHGLTAQKLEFLADRDFMQAAPDVYKFFSEQGATLGGHNIEQYDNKVLIYNLEICGFKLPVTHTVDTLVMARQHLTGSHKLENCVRTLAATLSKPSNFLETLFSETKILTDNIVDNDMRYHSALYDAFCSYCIYILMNKIWG